MKKRIAGFALACVAAFVITLMAAQKIFSQQTKPVFIQELSWSPDGSRISFSSNRESLNDVYVMNADGSHQIKLTK